MCICTFKIECLSNHISTDAQQVNICLLYFKKQDHIGKPMLFYPKLFVLLSILEYLSTAYVLCLMVVFSIKTYYSNRHMKWYHRGRIIHIFVWGGHQWLARRKESTLALFFVKLSLTCKPNAITTCFGVCTFNLCKPKAQTIKVETWKRKHEISKMKLFNVLKLRKCETHRFVLGYFYYKYADKL